MRAHLNDPGWFQFGSYAKFDRQARDILDGRQRLFWIDDPTRTELAQYPPAFPALVALIYKLTGDRSAYSVQIVLWFADLILIVCADCRNCCHRFRLARCHREQFSGRTVSVVCACMLRILQRTFPPRGLYLAATGYCCLRCNVRMCGLHSRRDVMLGIACWLRVNPLYLCVGWAIALFALVQAAWSVKLKLGAAVLVGTVVLIAPIVIRNYWCFLISLQQEEQLAPICGKVLAKPSWAGPTDFMFGDDKLIEHERIKNGLAGRYADRCAVARWHSTRP